MTTKEKLANALREEFERLKNHPSFDTDVEKVDYDLAIQYLETGKHPEYYHDYSLLYACIDDFEQMCNDYLQIMEVKNTDDLWEKFLEEFHKTTDSIDCSHIGNYMAAFKRYVSKQNFNPPPLKQ